MTDSAGAPPAPRAPLDLEPIRKRIELAQRMFGVSFDGYPDTERTAVDIQRDRDRSALLREVEVLRVELEQRRNGMHVLSTVNSCNETIWSGICSRGTLGCTVQHD